MLEDLLKCLDQAHIQYCVIGGQAVNAYTSPLVSLDLDLVVAADQIQQLTNHLKKGFSVKQFAHSLNISRYGSDLQVQIQTDPRYFDFIDRAALKPVLGLELPVAGVEDVLQGKIWVNDLTE